jgi:hypothetical protein
MIATLAQAKRACEEQYCKRLKSSRVMSINKNELANPVLYKGYKIIESPHGYAVNMPDVDKCKQFIDRFLETDL